MEPFGNDNEDLKEVAIPKKEGKFSLWKRLILFFIIFGIWVVSVIIIIIAVYFSEESENLEKFGEINCVFDIKNISISYPLLGKEFNKKNIDIIINDTKIELTDYKFNKEGENKVKYILYGNEFSMDYMFKNIFNLIKVEMFSDKNMSISSMISGLFV